MKSLSIDWVEKKRGLVQCLSRIQCIKMIGHLLIDCVLGWRKLFNISIKSHINIHNIIVWKQACLTLNVKSVVNSSCDILGGGGYYLELLNQISINTIVYLFSINIYPSATKKAILRRNHGFGEFLYKYAIVWNRDIAKSLLIDNKIKTIAIITGPLMFSKEPSSRVILSDFRNKYLGTNYSSNPFYISVFDVAPLLKNYNYGLTSFWPSEYTETLWIQFMSDIERLMNAFKDVVIIYKPKRFNPTNQTSHPAPSFLLELIERNENNPRWINLDYNINQWIPIMLCDLSISMPFSSSGFAAFNKGKYFLFHDADNHIKYHFYERLNAYITHSYNELHNKVSLIKSGQIDLSELQNTDYYVHESKERKFAQRFANFLRDPCAFTSVNDQHLLHPDSSFSDSN